MRATEFRRGGFLEQWQNARPSCIELSTHRNDRTAGYQWVREVETNGLESGATRIEFGVEWQAVASQRVYRRTIIDNGCGMTPEQLVEFFNTFGGGGKPIGGVHENFGVGSKTSLLPWNRYGVVVISRVDGQDAMIWIRRDPDTGEYGLKIIDCGDPETGDVSFERVFEPFDDPEHGCDWGKVLPDWVGDHGTAIVLLGNSASDDTVLGDPNREEGDIKGISSYLNKRIWQIPEGVEIAVDELRNQEKAKWPRSDAEAHGRQPDDGHDRRTNRRAVRGAYYFIDYPSGRGAVGKLKDRGTVTLSDKTEVDWFLWEGDRPNVHSYAVKSGYLAVLYKNELYDITSHHNTYRSFGISEAPVRQRVSLVVRPPALDDDGKHGVYPRTDRNALLLRGGPNAGDRLPLADWGAEFADQMPQAITDALRAARSGTTSSISDPEWRKRLADRFGSRWRISRVRAHKNGAETVDPDRQGSEPRKRTTTTKPCKKRSSGGAGGLGGAKNTGDRPGGTRARRLGVAGAIPQYRLVNEDALEPGMLAAWQAHVAEHPEGVVLINVDHAVIRQEVKHWQEQFVDHHADAVATTIREVYGEIAVAKVAHSEQLKTVLPAHVVEQELRSPVALTAGLLGLLAEEAVIEKRLRYKLSRRQIRA